MDPDATLADLADLLREADALAALPLATDNLVTSVNEWLDSGGFPPSSAAIGRLAAAAWLVRDILCDEGPVARLLARLLAS